MTDDRLAPVGLVAVDGDDAERFDFRSGRRLGTAQIDHAYTGLAAAADGRITVRLTTAVRRRGGDVVGLRLPVGADPHGRPSRRPGTGRATGRAWRSSR